MRIFDNLISLKENYIFYSEILNTKKFLYGEKDFHDAPPIGLSCELENSDIIFKKLFSVILNINDKVNLKFLLRSYINLFLPNERPFFHVDGNVTTYIFYICPETNLDEGGETQLVINNEVYNVFPKPGRLLEFDGNISHRATSFRSIPRITVVFKFMGL